MHRRALAPILIGTLFLAACDRTGSGSGAPGSAGEAGRLASEKSPYLRSHAANPVAWWPWGEEAFDEARRSNRPVFLSIGYSTCHWCHVMEEESFSDSEVAKILNESFVAIKVDREERPDVDEIYMTAVTRMTGNGGWPLSVWLLPDGRPFYGGTYYPRDAFLALATRLASLWKSDPARVREGASEGMKAIEGEGGSGPRPVLREDWPTEDVLRAFVKDHERRFDPEHGGFGESPKFPETMNLMALMRIARRVKDPKAEQKIDRWVTVTLERMGRGGIHDWVDGGFHRYATDRRWAIPHFEKMLPDQALLATVYLEGYLRYGKPEYEWIARRVLDYVLSRLTRAEGGFLSAEDADSPPAPGSKPVEGGYATFTPAELRLALGPSGLARLRELYDAPEKGNFEGGRVVLALKTTLRARIDDRAADALTAKLAELRAARPRPARDEKIVTAWNGLMIAAMARAGRALGEPRYSEAALRGARFVLEHLSAKGELMRRWIDGEARFRGYALDYAAMIHALLWLYETDFDARWLAEARALQEKQDSLFWNDKDGGYFWTDGRDKTVIVRAQEESDGTLPSADSLSVSNLLRLANLTYEASYLDRARRTIARHARVLDGEPGALPLLVAGVDFLLDRAKEVAVVGRREDPATIGILDFLSRGFLPNKVVAFSEPGEGGESEVPLLRRKLPLGGKTAVYVCEGKICKMPTTDLAKVRELMEDRRLLEGF